jgi:hypothetical protein
MKMISFVRMILKIKMKQLLTVAEPEKSSRGGSAPKKYSGGG